MQEAVERGERVKEDFLGAKEQKDVFGEEKSLWEELVGMYMFHLVRNWQEAS